VTTYYVRKTGSDSNAGTSAGAAFLTVGKAMATVASGDTVYIGAGIYRESGLNPTASPTAETKFIGDVDGVQTGDSGEVRLTAYVTSDTTDPTAVNVLNLSKNFLTFQKIVFQGATSRAINASVAGVHDIKFQDCVFLAAPNSQTNGAIISFTTNANAAANWTIDRCLFVNDGLSAAIVPVLTRPTGADFDYNVLIQNCVYLGTGFGFVRVDHTGANTFNSGGVRIYNCTMYTAGDAIKTNGANISTTIPVVVENCAILRGNGTGLNANTSGQIVEDYNLLACNTPRTNVTAGTHSSAVKQPLTVHFGQEVLWGANRRAMMAPGAGSPLLGFGGSGNGPTTVDFHSNPRPAGGGSALNAVGALERGQTAVKETDTVRTGANARRIPGPGYHDFYVPVDATSTTVTVYVRWDATYAGTKPQLKVLNGTECGVADASYTATGASGSWEQLTLTIVPTSKGVVTFRIQSNDTNGAGNTYWDDFAVT
jgi:hypothetical protein